MKSWPGLAANIILYASALLLLTGTIAMNAPHNNTGWVLLGSLIFSIMTNAYQLYVLRTEKPPARALAHGALLAHTAFLVMLGGIALYMTINTFFERIVVLRYTAVLLLIGLGSLLPATSSHQFLKGTTRVHPSVPYVLTVCLWTAIVLFNLFCFLTIGYLFFAFIFPAALSLTP